MTAAHQYTIRLVGRPTRRAPDPDDEEPTGSVANVANPTIVLETADLKDLAADGLVQARTMNVELQDIEPAERVVIDLGEDAKLVKRRAAAQPRRTQPIAEDDHTLPVGRTWIVVLVYVAAIAALGISIYWRFFK